MSLLDRNTVQSLNKDPKSLDLHSMALANMKQAKVSVGAMHDMISDRMRTKKVGNYDEAFKKLNELRKNGVLDIYNKRMNIKESTKLIKESTKLIKEDGAVAVSSGAPIASYGGTGFQIRYLAPGKDPKEEELQKEPQLTQEIK